MSNTNPRLPTYFISHGGGPWPWMKKEMGHAYDKLEAALADMPRQIGRKPDAILMVSAHWEEPAFTVMGNPRPPMIYDYGGFPAHTYEVHYDAPGSPELARRVQSLIEAAGLPVRIDAERGFDHGMFSPMAAMYPNAEVPVVQLSLRRGLDPAEHIALGRAIAPLRDENVLIVGSGLSYHNLRAFGPQARDVSKAFDDWLGQTAAGTTGDRRNERLLQWSAAPAARIAHPREEHLIPLMVAIGAAENEAGELVYHEDAFMGGIAVSSFRFGEAGASANA
ncbi:class III extradiol ring-cleavage dioxygenase [Variovorax sp. Sphag1AA]|uniref:DODA-type extradiol aromatic ring-opening family dioxygenase n=1 Tax=Variovorax sp. Sphag1AA TaxID=2587027 RepID=UPI00160CFEE7|nr:class III extradiol ring-cleavage dioxygenase [Variovorax sp. Sphag1AA]MBB3175809.1 aromatic ring-opening dioxygenase catalytic subunit (LigB family) [Variovorax sp. Sphag1AA]